MKFMVPSSDESMAGSLTDEEHAEAESYARGVGAKFIAMAGVYQSVEHDNLTACIDLDQVMGESLAVEAPLRDDTRFSPRKPEVAKAKVGSSWPDMDMGNEDPESISHLRKPQRPKKSYKKNVVDDEEDEDEESLPHLRKPQRGETNKGVKVTAAVQFHEDNQSPHKRSWGRFRKPSPKVKAAVVEVEDDEDEAEESPPRDRRGSRGRQSRAGKAKARLAEDEYMEDVIEKLPPRTRATRNRPPKTAKAAKAKARVVESADEDEDMDDVVDNSPPHIRGNHCPGAARRPKAKIRDEIRIDQYDEAALYTSYAGLSINAPNRTLDNAGIGEGMGHRKHK